MGGFTEFAHQDRPRPDFTENVTAAAAFPSLECIRGDIIDLHSTARADVRCEHEIHRLPNRLDGRQYDVVKTTTIVCVISGGSDFAGQE